MPFLGFILALRDSGISLGLFEILDFYRGLCRGLAKNLDELYLFARLCFVRRVEQYDLYDRVFSFYFEGKKLPPVAEGDLSLLETEEFQSWLEKIIQERKFQIHPNFWSLQELLEKFWETLREQKEEHHRGNKWIGTSGTSPFGHSGFNDGGLCVYGTAQNFSARKAIAERRYIRYSENTPLFRSKVQRAFLELRQLENDSSLRELDLDETIRKSALSGGEIEFVFRKVLRNNVEVILFIDNGGSSMLPYVEKTRMLFQKFKKEIKSLSVYFFHNTIYRFVFTDEQRQKSIDIEKILRRKKESRVFIVGDANMAPSELLLPYGNINYGEEDEVPSIEVLKKIRQRFVASVWLNPMPKHLWDKASFTLRKIREIFPMEELNLLGLKRAVLRMNRQNYF